VAEVKRAFAHHGIPLVRVEPSLGPRLRYTPLFGQTEAHHRNGSAGRAVTTPSTSTEMT
jgi:hypothetical protein